MNLITPAKQTQSAVERMVKKTAIELAGAFYDEIAHDNEFYANWPNEKHFVNVNWPHFVVAARQSMGRMLGMKQYDQETKELIYQALINDATLPWKRDRMQILQ